MEAARPAEPVRPAEEERHAALPDPGLQLVGLGLRDPSCLQVGLDLVDRGRLRRVLELLGRDAEVAATRARKLFPLVAEPFEAAIAPPAPTTSESAEAATSARLELSFLIGLLPPGVLRA